MRFLTITVCLLACGVIVAHATAAVPGLIDRPTPPPCAADGTCHPNTSEWGYYPVRWRTWPGVSFETAPAGAPTPEEQLGPELSPHETPPAELEDVQAPPGSTKRQPATTTPVDGEAPPENGEAPVMPTSPLDSRPTVPTTPPAADADPPPALPLSIASPSRRTASTARPAATRRGATPRATNDPPPQPPWSHRASL